MIERDLKTLGSGAIRDTTEGKVNYRNCTDNPMWERYAVHMTKAEATKGKRNWMQAGDNPDTAEEELERGYESLFRHTIQYMRGDTDEDHGAAVIFALGWIELIKSKTPSTPETRSSVTIPMTEAALAAKDAEAGAWGECGKTCSGRRCFDTGCQGDNPNYPRQHDRASVFNELAAEYEAGDTGDDRVPDITSPSGSRYTQAGRDLLERARRRDLSLAAQAARDIDIRVVPAQEVTSTGLDDHGDAQPESRGARMRRELNERGTLGDPDE